VTSLHLASFDELDPRTAYLLWQLREQVFVVEQECAYAELDGRDLEPGTRHLWAAEDGLPVGYVRLLDDGDRVRVGRVLVAPGHRGTGLADRLVETALDEIGERPSYLHAQTPLVGWYTRHGYVVDGEEYVEDGIPHTPMSRPTLGRA
jgi:ElaA protein